MWKLRAHSRRSVCVHSLPQEGAEGQKGEGRKDGGEKSIVKRGDRVCKFPSTQQVPHKCTFSSPQTRQCRNRVEGTGERSTRYRGRVWKLPDKH